MSLIFDFIVLSAGESGRMGYPKALLDYGNGLTFLERILSAADSMTIKPKRKIVVLGKHCGVIESHINLSQCIKVINPQPERGQLSSLICALNYIKTTNEDTSGILTALTDHPRVEYKTYDIIIKEASFNPGHIIIPTYNNKGGHPVFFPPDIFQDLVSAPLDQGARFAVKKNQNRVRRLTVEDPGILKDIDTKEEYLQEFNNVEVKRMF